MKQYKIILFLLLVLIITTSCCKDEDTLEIPNITWKVGWLNDQISCKQQMLIKVESSHEAVEEVRFQSLTVSGIAQTTWQLTPQDFSWSHYGPVLEGRCRMTFTSKEWKITTHMTEGYAKVKGRWYPIR